VFYAIAALVLVLVAAREIRSHGRQTAKAEAAEQRADSLALYAYQTEQSRLADSVVHAKERSTWSKQRDSLLTRADHAAQARPRVVTRIIEVAGDSAKVVQVATELESLHAVEVTALRSALAVSDSIIESQRLELVEDDYTLGQYRKALDAARDEAAAWERASKGGGLFGIKISPEIAFGGGVLATVAVGVLLR
jgi:hypothetical protein